jgi:hypothetical protein
MHEPADDSAALRLLECWLPLAQALREEEGWRDGAAALEALILRAAPLLQGAPSLAAARAILLVYHTQQGGE